MTKRGLIRLMHGMCQSSQISFRSRFSTLYYTLEQHQGQSLLIPKCFLCATVVVRRFNVRICRSEPTKSFTVIRMTWIAHYKGACDAFVGDWTQNSSQRPTPNCIPVPDQRTCAKVNTTREYSSKVVWIWWSPKPFSSHTLTFVRRNPGWNGVCRRLIQRR